ncbi:hypothetical protein [Nocardia brevicatena]|uniref:hypothetical protein n=1 Tax=Nocardia brevicatena TaxID=37327 RepID=UPI0002D97EFC|nr:hypothetical protein [Nocardia brevicatena]
MAELDPIWELDIADEGIQYDNDSRTVQDLNTGEVIGLDKWIVVTSTDVTARTVEYGVRVRAAEPPTVGRWTKITGQ